MSHHQLHADKLLVFPRLTRRNHRITSEEDEDYNCYAWAVGDDTKWWSPVRGYYWPDGVPRDTNSIESYIAAFTTEGFVVCADGAVEPGIEKIAIYVHPNGRPKHAALQLSTGRWTSKLGAWEDIEHESENDVAGDCQECYGEAHIYMQRPRATQ